MIWLQCEECAKPGNRCFQQRGIPYPNRRSISYVLLPCDQHPLCIPGQCIRAHCSYIVEYDEGSYSHWILAYETLKFDVHHSLIGFRCPQTHRFAPPSHTTIRWGVPYYVDLHDININNRRLNIPSAYFAQTGFNKGRYVIDTRTSFTFISRPAYNILNLQIGRGKRHLDLCHRRNMPFKGYNYLPIVTFHLTRGANLLLQRDIAFIVWDNNRGREIVCMGISPTNEENVSIIGAQSQANHVFVFNLLARVLYFGPHNCAQNP
uniref:Xylanase inhibitor C-terminal domain-containing protein n=1 Tax=Kalanchoe fedtschenkoi TaxID=63787 RepID=A0A7N0TIT6_KALFE